MKPRLFALTLVAILTAAGPHAGPAFAADKAKQPVEKGPRDPTVIKPKAAKKPPAHKPAPPPPPTVQSFKNSTYQVDLSADGNLRNLRLIDRDGKPASSDLVLAFAMPFTGASRNKKLAAKPAAITPIDARHVEVLIATENLETHEVDPEAVRFTYQFDDSEINVELKARPGVSFGFELPDTAQLVENLVTGREMALPAQKGTGTGGPLQSIRVIYSDSSELLFRWTGPGNHINAGENGKMGSGTYLWSMNGGVPNAKYNLVFRVARPEQPKTVLSSPQFQFRESVVGNIFFDADEKAFDVYLDKPELDRIHKGLAGRKLRDVRVTYRVTDHLEREVEQGEAKIDLDAQPDSEGTLSQRITLHPPRRGYFEIKARIEDADGAFRPIWKRQQFSVVEAIGTPEQQRAAMLETGRFDGWSRDGFIGFGETRLNLESKRLAPEPGVLNFTALVDKMFQDAQQRSQATGVNFHFMLFSGAGIPWAKTPQDVYGVYEQILRHYKDYNKNWETLNEPNILYRPQEYVEMYLKPLKLAAEKVDPQAKVIGGSICGFGYEFLDEIYKLGAKDYMDAVSIHPYIGIPYDVQFIPAIERTRAIMARYGDQDKPIWFTECGFGAGNLSSQVRAARNNVRRIFIQEQYGIPAERDFYYFTTNMGYLHFFVMENDGTMLPQAVALRGRKVRLAGTKYDGNLPFGVPFIRANVYRGEGRTMLAVWTFDATRPVQITTDARTARAWDMWDNPTDVAIKDGVLTVTARGEPTYIELPAKASVKAVPVKIGRNLADLTFGAEATASSENQPADLALDGRTFGGGWQDAALGSFPKWLEVSLPLPGAADRVYVYSAEGSKGVGCIRDMDVMGLVAGRYVKLAEVRGNTDAILEINFPTVTVEKVRLEILAGEPTATIFEVKVIASDKGSAAGDLVNWAAAENGGVATASSTNNKHEGAYLPAGAIDGKAVAAQWKDYTETVWIDDTPGAFPDWLQVDFNGKKKLTAVLVYTNNFHRFKPRDTGISDADLEAWDGHDWKVVGSVAGSKKGVLTFTMKQPVETDKIRLVVKDTNDHYKSAVMEIQALGAKQ